MIINLNSDFNDKFEKFETENKQLRETLDEFTSEMNIINRQGKLLCFLFLKQNCTNCNV